LKNLIIRSVSGTVYVSLIIGSLMLNKYLFAFVILMFSQIGLFEFYRFGGRNKVQFLYQFIGLAIFITFHLSFEGFISPKWQAFIFSVPLLFLSIEIFKRGDWEINDVAYKLIGYIYLLTPLILLDYLNLKSGAPFSKLVLTAFILVWANDSFAYLSGMTFGKHKLFERITPKKTWEGFLGGLLATLLVAWLLRSYNDVGKSFIWELEALFIGIAAVFGDFVESFFKRKAGVKDSGKIMPGHGGILDRIDSLLFVFPVVFIYFEIIK
jgi:phosphatidate cytidylyltransferase